MADITNVSQTASTAAGTTSSASLTTKAMGKEDFLKLLVAQLKNQDPLNPLDSKDFTAQLAQFSSLEQLIGISSELKNQSLSIMTLAHTQAVGLIGKNVTVNGENTIQVEGKPVSITYALGSDAKEVTITITDSNGKVVKTIKTGPQSAGTNTYTWDPGEGVTGIYGIQVSAKDAEGSAVTTSTMGKGTVEAVKFQNDSIYVVVGGKEYPFDKLVSVS